VQALVPFLETRLASLPLVDSLCLRLSIRRLWRRQRDETDTEDILETAYEFDGYGLYESIAPWQRKAELRGLLDRVQERNPSTVLEIGTGRGGTLYTWCRALEPELVISVDLPGGTYGGGYTESKTKLFSQFTDDADLQFVRRNSHDTATRDRVDALLGDRDVDFLYIDADHSYEGVKRDFELYRSLVADDGMVALHDIDHRLNDDPESPYGVKQFWQEVQNEYPTTQILSEPQERAYGNGIVYL
jgi:cephalosporin hydroxylase